MKKRREGRRILKSLAACITVAAMTAVTVLPGTLGSSVKAADDKMVLHWDMTQNEDETLKDLTGNGHSGKMNGTLENAKVEGIDVLKMTGGYVDIPDGTISKDAAEVTVNMLVKIDKNIAASWMWCLGASNKRYMYFTGCCSTNQGSVMRGGVGCVPDDKLGTGNGWEYESVINGNEALSVGEWQNVTITYKDNGKFIFYKNGVKQAETTLSEGNAGAFTLQQLMTAGDERDGYMGWSFYTGEDPKFQGTVADFRIYEKEMTEAEVKTLSDDMSQMLEDLKDNEFTEADINLSEADCLGSNPSKDEVTADLVLPEKTTVGASAKEASITKWTSEDPSVISDEGKVTRPVRDRKVTLTAEVTKNAVSVNKSLTFTVLGEATDEGVVKADKEALTVTNSEDVSGNLTLPETGENGSVITWASSNEAVISSKADGKIAAGKVNRQDKDTDVTLTATITCGEAVETKEIVCHVRAKAELEETTDYLFAYFPYTSFKDERVYFGISQDGLNFKALNDGNYVLESKAGTHGIRDPFVFRSHEGDKFYMIATDLTVAGLTQDGVYYPGMGWGQNQTQGSQSIVVWESDDLANWSEARLCKVSLDTAGCTWAPEAYWDDETEQYVVFWASKVSDDNYAKQRVYYTTTRDFHTFSEAKVWIEENGSVIDTTVIKVGDYYYRYTKNEDGNTNVYGTPSKRIYCERSKSLTATKWELVSNNSLNISGGQIEGGCIFKINTDDAENAKNMAALKGAELKNDDVYCLMADRTGATIFPGLSDDITKGWFNVLGTNSSAEVDGTTLYSMPDPVASHGTVMPITAEEYDNLMMKYEKDYVGKAALTNAIKKEIPETEKDKYTEESWNAYVEALAAAKAVEAKEDATQEEVDDALKTLKAAKDALEVKPAEVKLPYKDVAKDAWYYDAVVYNYVNKTMTGMKDDIFGPEGTLVRAQFASVLHKMNEQPVMEYTDVFSDVTEPDWFKDAVLWAADAKIVTGYTGTKLFGANDPVTRSQMATMMYRYAKDYKGYDVKADGDYSSFPDAGDVQEFAVDAMKWAVSEGIITGKTIEGELLLDPQGSANRAECATIIQRFMEKYGK